MQAERARKNWKSRADHWQQTEHVININIIIVIVMKFHYAV